MKHVYNFHQDPGHGWVAVPVRDCFALGLSPSDFSAYSYRSRSGGTLYLEEDSDAPTFLKLYKAKFGCDAGLIEKHTDVRHWIRSMPQIKD